MFQNPSPPFPDFLATVLWCSIFSHFMSKDDKSIDDGPAVCYSPLHTIVHLLEPQFSFDWPHLVHSPVALLFRTVLALSIYLFLSTLTHTTRFSKRLVISAVSFIFSRLFSFLLLSLHIPLITEDELRFTAEREGNSSFLLFHHSATCSSASWGTWVIHTRGPVEFRPSEQTFMRSEIKEI